MGKLNPKHLSQAELDTIAQLDAPALRERIARSKNEIWQADEAMMWGTLQEAEAKAIKSAAEEAILFCKGRLMALEVMAGWTQSEQLPRKSKNQA